MNVKLNIEKIKKNVAAAAAKRGADDSDITIIGVTKSIPWETASQMLPSGIFDAGENRVQEFLTKYEKAGKNVRWHMIGHLQTNKVKYIIDKVHMIHSLDSIKLATEINKRANKNISVLIEINIAGEDSKHGVCPENTIAFAQDLVKLDKLNLCGIMCVAPFVENPENNRVHFQKMGKIFVDMRKKLPHNNINSLSMGMSNDYIVAVEEGANIVRIGSAMFGER